MALNLFLFVFLSAFWCFRIERKEKRKTKADRHSRRPLNIDQLNADIVPQIFLFVFKISVRQNIPPERGKQKAKERKKEKKSLFLVIERRTGENENIEIRYNV